MRLGIAAFRSLLLNITQLHRLYLKSRTKKALDEAAPTYGNERGMPERAQAEKEIQLIEEETLDLVNVLDALLAAHATEWEKLFVPKERGSLVDGNDEEQLLMLEACLGGLVMLTKAGLDRFSARLRPKLAELTERSARLLACGLPLPDLTA
jgi:hypothetical protein